jgi:hypothetical protein
MIGHNTQCDFEFPFGPPATQIGHAKSVGAETMPEKAATLDVRFCQLIVPNQASATLRIRHWLWLAPAKTVHNSINSWSRRPVMLQVLLFLAVVFSFKAVVDHTLP